MVLKPPNVLFILVDDLGWAQVGYHTPTKPSLTPSIDSLARDGVALERHYCHKFCAPSRAAIQSGRAPIHVNVVNAPPVLHNPADPMGGFAGIPRNMTGLAELMGRGGYKTHLVGKWDAGMATPAHTPRGRGYGTTLCYFRHQNDYWSFEYGKCDGKPVRDLWASSDAPAGGGEGPALSLLNKPGCSDARQSGCVYEELLFERRVSKLLREHGAAAAAAAEARGGSRHRAPPPPPFFIFWSTHLVHGPYQVPAELRVRRGAHRWQAS